jgi:hypothetical protein
LERPPPGRRKLQTPTSHLHRSFIPYLSFDFHNVAHTCLPFESLIDLNKEKRCRDCSPTAIFPSINNDAFLLKIKLFRQPL